MQREVERPDLFPQAIHLRGERIGRHVVLRSPHGAGVGEAQFDGALVGQLGKALVVLPHRDRDGVPALPDFAQPLRVAAVRHDLGDGLDVEAAAGVLRVGAPLAAAVGAVHARRDGGELRRFLLIARRRHHQRQPQQVQLPALVGRQLETLELHGVFRVLRDRLDEGLVRPGVNPLGIDGDEVLLHPAGLVEADAELQELFVDVLEERSRVGGGRRRRRTLRRRSQ